MRMIINGASRGLGKALWNHFAGRGVVIYPTSKSGGQETIKVDSRFAEEIEGFFREQVEPPINVLINCTGIIHLSPIHLDGNDRDIIDTNLMGYWYYVKHVLPIMRENGGGYIINISSIRSTVPGKYKGAYSISKAGVDALTRAINVENFEYGIRATSICPDTLDTDMGRSISNPGESLIDPEEVVKTVEWLLSLNPKVLVPEVKILRRYPVV